MGQSSNAYLCRALRVPCIALSETLLHVSFLALQVFNFFLQDLEVSGVDTVVLWTE